MNINGIFKICLSASILICSIAFLIRSSTMAVANTPPFSDATDGKYQMNIVDHNNKLYILIWDTETGKNKLYMDDGGWWFPNTSQFGSIADHLNN